ncbi:hypothetical protein EES45_31845 [Streptomyces sp. ADI97-07]|nr:hypothetical protein EES45_31845 [Streptomyces sp. ADI97-07]
MLWRTRIRVGTSRTGHPAALRVATVAVFAGSGYGLGGARIRRMGAQCNPGVTLSLRAYADGYPELHGS